MPLLQRPTSVASHPVPTVQGGDRKDVFFYQADDEQCVCCSATDPAQPACASCDGRLCTLRVRVSAACPCPPPLCCRADTSPAPCSSTWSRASCLTSSRPCPASSTRRTSTGIPRAEARATTGCASQPRPVAVSPTRDAHAPVRRGAGCMESAQAPCRCGVRGLAPRAISGCRVHDWQLGPGGDPGDDRPRGGRCVTWDAAQPRTPSSCGAAHARRPHPLWHPCCRQRPRVPIRGRGFLSCV